MITSIRKFIYEISKLILILFILNAGIEYLKGVNEISIINPVGGYAEEIETSNTVEEVEPQIHRIDSYSHTGIFSAYTADVSQTDNDPLTMASTKKVYDGAIACPSNFDFGDQIEIEGYGIFTCEDRMNIRYDCFRAGNCKGDEVLHFDIFMWEYQDAIKFGRKELRFNIKEL